MRETVLCYIFKDNKCLMLLRNKKENDYNKDKWLGLGGKIEDGETSNMAVVREVYEESGLRLLSFRKRGIIKFINDDYKEIMHLYESYEFEGDLIECDEGELHWIFVDDILNLNLWDGDRVFLSKLLNTKDDINLTLLYENDLLKDVISN